MIMYTPLPTNTDWDGPLIGDCFLVNGKEVACVGRDLLQVGGRTQVAVTLAHEGQEHTRQFGATGYGAGWNQFVREVANG